MIAIIVTSGLLLRVGTHDTLPAGSVMVDNGDVTVPTSIGNGKVVNHQTSAVPNNRRTSAATHTSLRSKLSKGSRASGGEKVQPQTTCTPASIVAPTPMLAKARKLSSLRRIDDV